MGAFLRGFTGTSYAAAGVLQCMLCEARVFVRVSSTCPCTRASRLLSPHVLMTKAAVIQKIDAHEVEQDGRCMSAAYQLLPVCAGCRYGQQVQRSSACYDESKRVVVKIIDS